MGKSPSLEMSEDGAPDTAVDAAPAHVGARVAVVEVGVTRTGHEHPIDFGYERWLSRDPPDVGGPTRLVQCRERQVTAAESFAKIGEGAPGLQSVRKQLEMIAVDDADRDAAGVTDVGRRHRRIETMFEEGNRTPPRHRRRQPPQHPGAETERTRLAANP